MPEWHQLDPMCLLHIDLCYLKVIWLSIKLLSTSDVNSFINKGHAS